MIAVDGAVILKICLSSKHFYIDLYWFNDSLLVVKSKISYEPAHAKAGQVNLAHLKKMVYSWSRCLDASFGTEFGKF